MPDMKKLTDAELEVLANKTTPIEIGYTDGSTELAGFPTPEAFEAQEELAWRSMETLGFKRP